MTGIITANVVMSSSIISIEEAISGDVNNDSIIFSIKNHELTEFTHSFDSGQFSQGSSKTSNVKIRIEFLDSLRIFDPRIIGNGKFKYVYFYYGVGDKVKDWTGPIAGVIDPTKITYGTFSDGKRTFVLEYTGVVANYENIPMNTQQQAGTSQSLTPLFSIQPSVEGGIASPINDFHKNIEKMFVDYVKVLVTDKSDILAILPDFNKIKDNIAKNLEDAIKANAAAINKDADPKKPCDTVSDAYIKYFQDFLGIRLVKKSTDGTNSNPQDTTTGKVMGADPGLDGRIAIETGYDAATSTSIQLHGAIIKDPGITLYDYLSNLLQKWSSLYENGGGLMICTINDIPTIKLMSEIVKKTNCPISGNTPITVCGDRNLIYCFIYARGGDETLLSSEDQNIYSKSNLNKIREKTKIDVSDTIFDDPKISDKGLPVFKIGEPDPNILDFKIDINANLYRMISNVWAGVSRIDNITKNSISDSSDETLKTDIDDIKNKISPLFEKLIQSSTKNFFDSGFFTPDIPLLGQLGVLYVDLQTRLKKSLFDNILVFQHPWVSMGGEKINLASRFSNEITSLIYDGVVKTPPFFKFVSPIALGQGCYIKYSDPVYTANESGSKLGEAFTGTYFVKGFKHTISSNGAYSEFVIQKLIGNNDGSIIQGSK